MNLIRSQPVSNEILKCLSPDVFHELEPLAQRMSFVPNQALVEQGNQSENVYFIERGIVSLIQTSITRPEVHVAVLGREGAAGLESLLNPTTVAQGTYRAQLPGEAIRFASAGLVRVMADSPNLRTSCLSAFLTLTGQIMRSAAANGSDSVAKRLIRFLLTMHDRLDGDDVPLKHGDLALLMGFRRPSVSHIATQLEALGLIRTHRGRIEILDRPALEREVFRETRMVAG